MNATAPTTGVPAINPFLPLNEYIPDGEPHVFGDRVYLFGSRDSENGATYCELDYVFYSAPIDDLSAWSSNGVNYRASQDPSYRTGRPYMYAPDVVQGNDDRFYLYYCMSGRNGTGGHKGPISVAVADTPDGVYEYLGFVRSADGSPFDEYVLFDPAVINDDGTIRLYYGTCFPFTTMPAITLPLQRQAQLRMYGKNKSAFVQHPEGIQGAITVELHDDMLTVRGVPSRIIPEDVRGTSFQGHAFWEGSSIRKIDDRYFFVYSSFNSHELCYATSPHPDRNFIFRGTIISNGDIGLHGRKPDDRSNQTGTNHGSIEQIGDQWYVFYHRNTHGSICRRQACAEPITIEPDGTIRQVPVTSSGLSGAPLPADRTYPAVMCSSLVNGKMAHGKVRSKRAPLISHDETDRFITNIQPGTEIAYKHFRFTGPTRITVSTRGDGHGWLDLSTAYGPVGAIPVTSTHTWGPASALIDAHGPHELRLSFRGTGKLDLLSIALDTDLRSGRDVLTERKKS